jgi:hypothetical protein
LLNLLLVLFSTPGSLGFPSLTTWSISILPDLSSSSPPPRPLWTRSSPTLNINIVRHHRSTSTSTSTFAILPNPRHPHQPHTHLHLAVNDHSHEVVYHEITDNDKTFALRLNEKLDVRVAEIAKSEQARKESEAQARKAHQTRTLTEEEIAEALAMLGDIKKRCPADMVPRITLSVPELFLTEPENQDEEDARFAEQQVSVSLATEPICVFFVLTTHSPSLRYHEQARRVWTDFSRLVVPPSMWTADERGQEIEDEEETY